MIQSMQPTFDLNQHPLLQECTATPLSPEQVETFFDSVLMDSLLQQQPFQYDNTVVISQDTSATPLIDVSQVNCLTPQLHNPMHPFTFHDDLSFISPTEMQFSMDFSDIDYFSLSACNTAITSPITPNFTQLPLSSPATSPILSSVTPIAPTSATTTKSTTTPETPKPSPSRTPRKSKDARPRNHECTICGQKFLRYQDVYRHQATHNAARSHVCPFGCGSKFGRSDALTRHMKGKRCMERRGEL
ncbi:hypothetical protein HDU99_003143 [Rhizoclosmatium hyalinum]|nr:hypothetical protein HDU99_003143 [Rhizoclosmatium hyalinum]